jgi:hypothetical protein
MDYETHIDNSIYQQYEEETTREKRKKIIIILAGYIMFILSLYYFAHRLASGAPEKEIVWGTIILICGLPSLCLLPFILKLISTVKHGETIWSEILRSGMCLMDGYGHQHSSGSDYSDEWMDLAIRVCKTVHKRNRL